MALTDISHPTDIAMLTDLYELTMAQGLWESGKANEQGCFTAFYRDHPFGSAYAVTMAVWPSPARATLPAARPRLTCLPGAVTASPSLAPMRTAG